MDLIGLTKRYNMNRKQLLLDSTNIFKSITKMSNKEKKCPEFFYN